MIEPPRELKPFPYFMSWHPRLTNEPAQAWLRDQIRTTARSIRGTQRSLTEKGNKRIHPARVVTRS